MLCFYSNVGMWLVAIGSGLVLFGMVAGFGIRDALDRFSK